MRKEVRGHTEHALVPDARVHEALDATAEQRVHTTRVLAATVTAAPLRFLLAALPTSSDGGLVTIAAVPGDRLIAP